MDQGALRRHQLAYLTAEKKQIASENDQAYMLAKKGAAGDGGFFADRGARDTRETGGKTYAAITSAA